MIHPRGPSTPVLPWEERGRAEGLAFACLWSTGPDPGSDALFRVQALALDGDAGESTFERWVALDAQAGDEVSARMAREFGVQRDDLRDAVPAGEALVDLLAFLDGRAVVVPDRQVFEAWVARHSGTGEVPRGVVGLPQLAALWRPGRLAGEGEALTAALLDQDSLNQRPRALDPAQLRRGLAELAGGVLASGERALALLAHAYLEVWEAVLEEGEELAAEELALALSLLEHPGAWAADGSLFAAGQTLTDGRLSAVYGEFDELLHVLEDLRPAWGLEAKAERRREPMPTVSDEPCTLSETDQRRVDEILQEHLPRAFAAPGAAPGSYREGQHAVAAQLARGFGLRELLLVHAPTGTGKTLAYLVPVLLWALRNSVRVGVATYTRALQEQAMDREVPLARELLRRAGVSAGAKDLRVALLKGRENYLCWRALRLLVPHRRDAPHEKLAWAVVALFALHDLEGDLDRLTPIVPLALADPEPARRAVQRLVRQVRSRTGCCVHRDDREDCAGLAARQRAERAHVVVTNHAFALARREFFRHLVFDECEHLHAQAHAAFSTAIPFRNLRELLVGLHKPGGSRAPLSRIEAVVIPETEAAECLKRCLDGQDAALGALDQLQRAVYRFKLWRDEAAGARQERDLHSLFREFVLEEEEAADLLGAHRSLADSLTDLAVLLAEIVEHLSSLPSRGMQRVRRNLDVQRADLDELTAGVVAWIPRDSRQVPNFRPETFYDLETTPGGYDVMAARVLLPHEHLGRHYYPDLAGAVLLSATTWLKGGFEAAAHYLGCQRAAEPHADEDREPTRLVTFRAPDAFDYGRVLVAAPRDAPAPNLGRRAHLEYVARLAMHLGERTRGRILVLFTSAEDCARAASLAEPFFAARRIPFWFQRMEGTSKEELSERFRAQVDSVLFGLDTFWYGADFPGETLEYLVIARLPYGVPDRYHHAQCAVLGPAEQRSRIYMPRALAKFRQGFGRLMRKESDRGCVFLLDARVHDPRHRGFLKELPLRIHEEAAGARYVRGDTDHCLREAFAHMSMGADVRRRGLDRPFDDGRADLEPPRDPAPGKTEIPEEELPF